MLNPSGWACLNILILWGFFPYPHLISPKSHLFIWFLLSVHTILGSSLALQKLNLFGISCHYHRLNCLILRCSQQANLLTLIISLLFLESLINVFCPTGLVLCPSHMISWMILYLRTNPFSKSYLYLNNSGMIHIIAHPFLLVGRWTWPYFLPNRGLPNLCYPPYCLIYIQRATWVLFQILFLSIFQSNMGWWNTYKLARIALQTRFNFTPPFLKNFAMFSLGITKKCLVLTPILFPMKSKPTLTLILCNNDSSWFIQRKLRLSRQK